ncbi:MAG: glycoside hydrolase family 26 [Gammaproteobacteria bacterium]|nr:MAG: glycoside hydrolase family 26 [Gammaproteobacteria bacterium]
MKTSCVKRYGLAALFSVGLASAQGAAAQTATCKYVVTNSWGAGATASIEVTNTGTSVLNGWNVNWAYVNNRISSSWNATITGANPYSASNLSWNGTLQPGQTASFGLQVTTSGAVETPVVTGAVCSGVVSSASSSKSSVVSSVVSSSKSSVASSKSSVASSSVVSSSSVRSSSSLSVASSSRSSTSVASSVASSTSSACASSGQQCNWYGTLYPSCTTTTSGWGYENGKSCIANSTCASQPAPYGVVGGSCGVSSSSLTSSSVKSSSSSSSSSVKSSSSSSAVATSSSSIASSSSSSSSLPAGVIPNATGAGVAYCRSADSDPDGDGWGWENAASCVVFGSRADTQGVGNFAYCVIGSSKLDLCTADTGSWGSQGGKVCLSKSMCPGMASNTQTALGSAPVNPNANATTRKVYTYLKSIWGTHTLSGQMDLTWQDAIDQYQRVINDTGRAPAIMGYDFMNYGLFWNGISGITQSEEAIAHWNRGGLVTFNWHWRDPDAAAGAIGDFYTEKTKFTIPIKNGELDTTSPSFTHIEANVAMIAAELQKLQTAGVTVLWRPLHEASGGWFWWGRSDRTDGVPPAYAEVVLWKYLYNRLTTYYGLNNLIWIWNGQSAAWYPGDAYVDIVSTDIYDGARNYKSQISAYNLTKSYPHQTKLTALSENSNIPDPDLIKADGAWWLYFLVWDDVDTAEGVSDPGNFWTGEYYNTNAHKFKVYNSDVVITLDELPKFTP